MLGHASFVYLMIPLLFFIGWEIFILYRLIITSSMRLEVSYEGIAFYGTGYRIYAPWETIILMNKVKHPYIPFYQTDVFVVQEPALRSISLEEGKQRGLAVVETHWLVRRWLVSATADPRAYARYIPLPTSFIAQKDREQGILADYIHYYAALGRA